MDATNGTGREEVIFTSTADIGDSFFDFSYYPTTILRQTKHFYPLFGSLEGRGDNDE